MNSYKLLAKITLDKEYEKGEIITQDELGTYLNYFDSIGILELVETEKVLPEVETETEKTKEVLPSELENENSIKNFPKSKNSK